MIFFVGMVLLGSGCLAPVRAAHSREEAVGLVRRAAEFLRSHDRATALAAFSDPWGAFRDGDLYLFVLDASEPAVAVVAHGGNPAMIGVADPHLVDAAGEELTGRALALANARGEGWIDYEWPNPTTKKIGPKSAFLLKVGTLILGAGVYR